jgi:aminoglycoside phosphotransferase (APT) family kinase protein
MKYNSRISNPLSFNEIERVVKCVFSKHTTVHSIEELTGGLFNTTYLIGTIRPKKCIVLRVAPWRQELLFGFERQMMSAEAYVYDLLKLNGIPAPTVVRYDDTHMILPRDYIITEYIESIPLSSPSFPVENRSKILYDLGVYMQKMHSIESNLFERPNSTYPGSGFCSWKDFILEFAQEIFERVREYDVFEVQESHDFIKWFQSNSCLFDMPDTPRLLHNDLWESNILVREARGDWEIAAIIDADRAIYGDREYELATSSLVTSDFIRGYGRSLNMTREAKLRQKAYALLLGFFNSYVFRVQIEHLEMFEYYKEKSLRALKDLRSF